MKAVSLTAFPRTLAGRNAVKQIRAAGRIPAVIYGRHAAPQNLEVDAEALDKVIHLSVSENILLDLKVENDARAARLALVQDVQHDALDGHVLHVDFHEVVADERVVISVPVESAGVPDGVRNGGGVLEHLLFKVKVRALPADLPDHLTVDVSTLKLNEAVHIGELPLPAGVEAIGDRKTTVFKVAAPRTEAEETAAAPAAGEVEMIKEKKDEGAAGAKPSAAGAKPAAADKGKDAAKAEKAPEKKK
jgi:large subunit ribosomal protein L25